MHAQRESEFSQRNGMNRVLSPRMDVEEFHWTRWLSHHPMWRSPHSIRCRRTPHSNRAVTGSNRLATDTEIHLSQFDVHT